MLLVAVMLALLVTGLALTALWVGRPYREWAPGSTPGDGEGGVTPTLRQAALRYLRGFAVALVAGFWTGALVTGPGGRLIMRLLAVTAGDQAQGAVTEADQVVGEISVDGTLGLLVFGGILPGLLSGAIYVVIRRWLPAGRVGGVTFGLLHLIVAATRVDPLRPENPDFDIVGPGWLSLVTFALLAVVHGMAVAAIANRYSAAFPPPGAPDGRRFRVARSVAPLVVPGVLILAGAAVLVAVLLGLALTVAASQVPPLVRAVRSRTALTVGRIALALFAGLMLPGAVSDLRAVVDRPGPAAGPPAPAPAPTAGD